MTESSKDKKRFSGFVEGLQFNDQPATLMHIDLNSCFATVEQQANPTLRGKPIAVAAYNSPGGCILAPSVEAKRYGIKTGMSVRDGRKLYKDLIVLEPDPWKYRNVHIGLKKLLQDYTENVFAKSIDEFVLDLNGFPAYSRGMLAVGLEIKQRIKKEIGDFLTVSIGISTNRYLAKIASGLKKPDGLDIISEANYSEIFARLKLDDLTGIKRNNMLRLNNHAIFSVLDFYDANPMQLQQAFHAVTGHYWYLRLRGYEVDDTPSQRRSYSNSVALGKNLKTPYELAPILSNLVEKMSARMRNSGYSASGVHLSVLFKKDPVTRNDSKQQKSPQNIWSASGSDHYWHKGFSTQRRLFSSTDIYKVAYKLLEQAPHELPVHIISVTCFNLILEKHPQTDLFSNIPRVRSITKALDAINDKWGDFVLKPAKMLSQQGVVKDRISFGGVKELQEIVIA